MINLKNLMNYKKLKKCFEVLLVAAVVLASVWLVVSGEFKPHSVDQLAKAIVSDIRADVLLGDGRQIEAKLARAKKKYSLAYLSFERSYSGRSSPVSKSDWQLAGNNDLSAGVYPVEVGGLHYGWLNLSSPTKAQYDLILIFGSYIVLFVFYVKPKFFPWQFYFSKKSPLRGDALKTSELLVLAKGKDSHRLSIHYTVYRPVRGYGVQLLSPSVQGWCETFPAFLSIRELATLAMGNHLYRPAYKWLIIRALRGMGEQCGLNDGVRFLLPITGLQLINREFFDELKTLILIEDVEPSRIIIEIHESLVGQHTRENLTSGLSRFEEYGFGICIDGFGSTDKSKDMLGAGPITHVRWCVEPGPEWTSTYWTEKGQALAQLAQKSGVRVIRTGLIDPASEHPLANMVSWYSHERYMFLSSELQTALHRQLLSVTYQDVYSHDV